MFEILILGLLFIVISCVWRPLSLLNIILKFIKYNCLYLSSSCIIIKFIAGPNENPFVMVFDLIDWGLIHQKILLHHIMASALEENSAVFPFVFLVNVYMGGYTLPTVLDYKVSSILPPPHTILENYVQMGGNDSINQVFLLSLLFFCYFIILTDICPSPCLLGPLIFQWENNKWSIS